MRERQIHLHALVRSAGSRPAQEEIGCVEIEMEIVKILAREELDLMIVLACAQAFAYARCRKFKRVCYCHGRHGFRLVRESVLKSDRMVPKTCLRHACGGLAYQGVGVPANLQI